MSFYNIILFCTFFFCSFVHGQDSLSCSTFRTGQFYCTSPNGGEIFINRKRKKQIEQYNKENQRFIFQVNWLSPCTYELTLLKTKRVAKRVKRHIIGQRLLCHIIETKEDEYVIKIASEENDNIVTTKIYQIK